MKRSHGGYSKKSRSLKASKTSLGRRLAQFEVGSKVRLTFNPVFLKGRPNKLRFNNRIGMVLGKQGAAFKVEFLDGGKKKMLVLSNVHLKRV